MVNDDTMQYIYDNNIMIDFHIEDYDKLNNANKNYFKKLLFEIQLMDNHIVDDNDND